MLALAAHMAKTKENGHPPLDDDQMQSHSSDSSDSSDNDGDDNETATEYIVTSPQSPVAVAVAESNGTNGGDGGGGGAYDNITANDHRLPRLFSFLNRAHYVNA